ncbi:MAG TPA: aryl-sulfate sulfotransferase, partial [Candidatus Eisenbacteria bacterium]|nr:aryl-sulfate sulfotransferase [Candidatus Eisenbacteria bacterium]
TLFDNGNFHTPAFSRALEYDVDENALTARLVWHYPDTQDVFSVAMGFVERLDNGDTLIGFGAAKPDIVEVDPGGNPVLTVTLPPGIFSYRASRSTGPNDLAVGASGAGSPGLRLEVRPNPCRSRAQTTLRLGAEARVSMRVYDAAGRVVVTPLDHAVLDAGDHRVVLDLTGWRPGVYFVRAEAGGRAYVRKLQRTR